MDGWPPRGSLPHGRLLSVMADKPSNDWILEPEACAILNVAPRTLARLVEQKRIQKDLRERAGKPPVSVFHPGDIEQERQRRHPPQPAFVMRPDSPNLPMRQVADIQANHEESLIKAFLPLVGRMAEIPAYWPLFLTTEQAIQYTGMSAGYLDGLVKQGTLKRIEKGIRGYRYRRADLDTL